MSHFFSRLKRLAFEASSIKKGDRVMVLCCATGLDFYNILRRIGREFAIVGADFSSTMLKRAVKRYANDGWDNIELFEADATEFRCTGGEIFDAEVCTLGMSIIPEYRKAYHNHHTHVKKQGHIVIGDIPLA
jgi:demethylmenaquinone methyltransferase/2-methoxy-6-polyprenyl-1,4-benzoquinol methylase